MSATANTPDEKTDPHGWPDSNDGDGVDRGRFGNYDVLCHEHKVVKVGDLVQFTINGADQFTEPRPILGLSPDGDYAFVPGSDSGLPVSQLTVAGRAMNDIDKKPLPPANPFKGVGVPQAKSEEEAKPLPPGLKQAVLPLDTGEMLVRWPAKMTADEVKDFEEWVPILIRKMKRAVQGKVEDDE